MVGIKSCIKSEGFILSGLSLREGPKANVNLIHVSYEGFGFVLGVTCGQYIDVGYRNWHILCGFGLHINLLRVLGDVGLRLGGWGKWCGFPIQYFILYTIYNFLMGSPIFEAVRHIFDWWVGPYLR